MLPDKELSKALRGAPLISLSGPWTRAVRFRYLQRDPLSRRPPKPLWPGGAKRDGARFTPKGGFGSLYLASDAVTALKEVEAASVGVTIRNPPWILLTVEGFLEHVLDLTEVGVQDQLGTTLAELTGDWRYSQGLFLTGKGAMPPSQRLASLAQAAGKIVAIRYHSAKNTGDGFNMVVFTDRLVRGRASFLEVYDPDKVLKQRLPASR